MANEADSSCRRTARQIDELAETVGCPQFSCLSLSSAQRVRLVEKLIASRDSESEVENASAVEVERRHAEMESGAVSLLSGPESLARLRAEFQ